MPDPTAVVNRVTETTSFTSQGTVTRAYNVQFSVGEHGPFTITVPAEQFNPEKVKAEIAAVAATINSLTASA